MNRRTERNPVKISSPIILGKKVSILIKKESRLENIVQRPYGQEEKFFYIYKTQTTVEKTSKSECALYGNRAFYKGDSPATSLTALTLLDVSRFKLVDYEEDLTSLAGDIQIKDLNSVQHGSKSICPVTFMLRQRDKAKRVHEQKAVLRHP